MFLPLKEKQVKVSQNFATNDKDKILIICTDI